MPSAAWSLSRDAVDLEQVVRMLGAGVNVRILRTLAQARRKGVDDGWMSLSDVARALDEAPGTVAASIQKLLPLLEERREKGRRLFRATLVELRIETEKPRR